MKCMELTRLSVLQSVLVTTIQCRQGELVQKAIILYLYPILEKRKTERSKRVKAKVIPYIRS